MIGRLDWGKPTSVTYLLVVYLAAVGLAASVAEASIGLGDWQALLLADVAATFFVFAMAVVANNTSVYDPYWSVAPVPLAIWWAVQGSPDTARFAVVLGLIAVWSIRLTGNFLRGWTGLTHEDWRYTEYRRFGPARYWMVSLGGLQMMPTLIVFAAMLPVLAVTRSPGRSFGFLDVIAIAVTAAAIALETIADEQKRRHAGEGFVVTGVWAWLRHPNYLGEVAFWWGLFLFALAAGSGNWWTVAGPIAMTILFAFISVPLMDRRMLRRPGYADHMEQVPALIPRRPR